MNVNPIYKTLLKKGRSDLKVAVRELSNQDAELEIVCFHLQQFVEKYLKAFLFFNGNEPKRTHNIVFLLNESILFEKDFEKYIGTEIIELNECGVEIRYDYNELIELGFIQKVLEIALNLKKEIEDKLLCDDMNKLF